ncbi:MAG: vWA domain-containing protein [Bacillota bacterium]
MKKAPIYIVPALILALYAALPFSAAGHRENVIQMAILLDTSNSMDGLIDQAKSQLWKIVNELARARKNGKTPGFEVALYEYGKSSLPSGEGYLRMIVPLSTDLDRISEELFNLATYGGEEYCGHVIKSAVNGLHWSNHSGDYKVIVIAGNEPFTQGNVDYRKSCGAASAKGIIVNTIFCGERREGILTQWKDGAEITGGSYMNIDHNYRIPEIIAPQDEEILELNRELNNTYIPYGKKGEENKARQETQDANAASESRDSYVQRSMAKASPLYDNAAWDLVDAVNTNGAGFLDKLKEEELPEVMRRMTREERREYIASKIKERERIKNRLNELQEERRVYIGNTMKNLAGQNSFDMAVIEAVRRQAAKKGFWF